MGERGSVGLGHHDPDKTDPARHSLMERSQYRIGPDDQRQQIIGDLLEAELNYLIVLVNSSNAAPSRQNRLRRNETANWS